MKWDKAKELSPGQFRRFVGIERPTFDTMVMTIDTYCPPGKVKRPGKKRGAKPKLSTEDRLLMLWMYYREYRTFFHTGAEFGLSEVQCWRIITAIEKILIASGLFHLPGKKKLQNDHEWEVIVVDASEHTIERPKKNRDNIIQEKRRNTPLKAK